MRAGELHSINKVMSALLFIERGISRYSNCFETATKFAAILIMLKLAIPLAKNPLMPS